MYSFPRGTGHIRIYILNKFIRYITASLYKRPKWWWILKQQTLLVSRKISQSPLFSAQVIVFICFFPLLGRITQTKLLISFISWPFPSKAPPFLSRNFHLYVRRCVSPVPVSVGGSMRPRWRFQKLPPQSETCQKQRIERCKGKYLQVYGVMIDRNSIWPDPHEGTRSAKWASLCSSRWKAIPGRAPKERDRRICKV